MVSMVMEIVMDTDATNRCGISSQVLLTVDTLKKTKDKEPVDETKYKELVDATKDK